MQRRIKQRLSSVELLSGDAKPLAQWAFDQIEARQLSLREISVELNRRLAELDMSPVSYSALGRYSQRVCAKELRRPVGAAPAVDPAPLATSDAEKLLAVSDGIAETILAATETIRETVVRLLELREIVSKGKGAQTTREAKCGDNPQ